MKRIKIKYGRKYLFNLDKTILFGSLTITQVTHNT